MGLGSLRGHFDGTLGCFGSMRVVCQAKSAYEVLKFASEALKSASEASKSASEVAKLAGYRQDRQDISRI